MHRILVIGILFLATACAADLPTKAEVAATLAKAEAYLLAQQQPDGGFTEGARYALGITQLAAIGLTMPPGLPASDPRIAKAITFMEAFSQPDGGLYPPEEGLGTYYTSLALLTWQATGTGRPERIAQAQNYLFGVQETRDGINQGGFGYGGRKGSEDLSNSSFAIQALRGTGIPASDARMQAAVKFLERCQDLSSVNRLPWASGNSGGAVYTPDQAKAAGSWLRQNPGKTVEDAPKMQPYGSMTYHLIQSYAALDLKKDDPRLHAALNWVQRNYRFDANPGITRNKGKEGLFYYYMGMAKTFGIFGLDSFAVEGRTVDWRADLYAAIKDQSKILKNKDGSEVLFWINDADRWGEGSPPLSTCYMIHALKRIHAALP